MPRNSQSPPNAVDTTSSDSLGWARRPRGSARCPRRSCCAACRAPRPSTSTTSPGCTGREFAGVPDRITSPGSERDRSGDVGDEVVHVPDHLVGVAVLDTSPFTNVRMRLAVEVPVVDDARSERAQGVGALHAQHRARVGVTEVVQAVVVRDRVAGDPLARLVGGDVRASGCPMTIAISPS